MSSAAPPPPPPTDEATSDVDYDASPPEPSRAMEVALAVAAILLMGTAFFLAQDIELRREVGPGQIDARFWPEVLALTGLALGVWRLVVALTKRPDSREDQERVQPGGARRVAVTVLAVVVFIALWNERTVTAMGYRTELFPVITFLLLVVLVRLYGARGVRALLLFPLLMTAGIYVLFDMLLRIPL